MQKGHDRRFKGFLTLFLLVALAAKLGSETMTLTTYYPSPTGVYKLLTSTMQTILARDGGNVGIGTTSPQAKLELAGQIKITGGSPGLNKVLVSDGSGLASWQTNPNGSCQPNYADAGNYCIEKNPRPPATWWAATATCQAAGAKLCSYIEWYPACAAGLPGLSGMPPGGGVYEWIGDMAYWGGQIHAVIQGNTSCSGAPAVNNTVQPPAAATHPFRCCMGK